jgi:hypothetical protein
MSLTRSFRWDDISPQTIASALPRDQRAGRQPRGGAPTRAGGEPTRLARAPRVKSWYPRFEAGVAPEKGPAVRVFLVLRASRSTTALKRSLALCPARTQWRISPRRAARFPEIPGVDVTIPGVAGRNYLPSVRHTRLPAPAPCVGQRVATSGFAHVIRFRAACAGGGDWVTGRSRLRGRSRSARFGGQRSGSRSHRPAALPRAPGPGRASAADSGRRRHPRARPHP